MSQEVALCIDVDAGVVEYIASRHDDAVFDRPEAFAAHGGDL